MENVGSESLFSPSLFPSFLIFPLERRAQAQTTCWRKKSDIFYEIEFNIEGMFRTIEWFLTRAGKIRPTERNLAGHVMQT